jgi:hypothetical protein
MSPEAAGGAAGFQVTTPRSTVTVAAAYSGEPGTKIAWHGRTPPVTTATDGAGPVLPHAASAVAATTVAAPILTAFTRLVIPLRSE